MSLLLPFILLNRLAFTDVDVIPMDSDQVLHDQVVVVENGRIVSMGPADRVRLPAGLRRIDGSGRFLIPGLVDTHIHIPPEASDEKGAANELLLFVAHGVTTARVMIGQREHLRTRRSSAWPMRWRLWTRPCSPEWRARRTPRESSTFPRSTSGGRS